MRSKLLEANTSEFGIRLLNFIRFKFTTGLPISHLAAVSDSASYFIARIDEKS